MRQPKHTPARTPPYSASAAPETVDPGWILKALGALLALGLLCSYVTLCLYFYYGQWQLVLHPAHTLSATPASQNLPFQPVRFGNDLAGKPQIAGWWIPSDLPSDPVALVLHSETGTRSDALAYARILHDARVGVLLFDYRGYGDSGGEHPTERRMQQDAQTALHYLTSTRKIPLSQIVVFGTGLGASLATHLCTQQQRPAALLLVSADGDTTTRVLAEEQSRLVPVRLIFHERFPLADPLSRLAVPKLLISFERGPAPEYALRAATPKTTVELAPGASPVLMTKAVRAFLDQYVAHPPAVLTPEQH